MPTPPTSHPIRIKIYSIDNALLEGATVELTLGTNNPISKTSNSKGEVVLNVANAGSWNVSDEVSITASKTGNGRKTSTLVLTSSPQETSLTLEETSDLRYEESPDDNYNLNFALLTTFDGEKVNNSNRLPVVNQHPLEKYQLSDLARGTTEYWGYLDKDGNWYILRFNRSTGARRYVRGSSGYVTKYANRTSLSYDYFNEVF